ncbi:MAG: hypothetical protein ACM3ST_15590 [Bdellovibrio bacteriovorus]
MRQVITTLALSALIATPVLADDNRLEPAINGQVSASGIFATQAGEDWHEAQRRIATELRAEHQLALLHQAELDPQLEPCINGNVSPSGLFASPELEEAANALAGGELTDVLKRGAYAQTTLGRPRAQND